MSEVNITGRETGPFFGELMEFTYIGHCAAGFVTLYGVTFRHGEPVNVENPTLVAKLRANSHFLGKDEAEEKEVKRRGRPPKVVELS